MRLLGCIIENMDTIIEKWYNSLIMSYPQESLFLLKNNRNKFTNPMSYTFFNELKSSFESIFISDDAQALQKSLDNIIKIRAVQDLKPSQAISFITSLRTIILNHLIDKIKNTEDLLQFFELDLKINNASNIAYDLYLHERERLMEIKSHETLNRYGKMLERLERKYDR